MYRPLLWIQQQQICLSRFSFVSGTRSCPEPVNIIIYIVADWPTGQSLFLISHPDVKLVNILLSTTRVSLAQNKFVFCQLRVHYIGDPDITKTYLGIQHVNILQYLHELNGNVHYINISNVPTLNCAACRLQQFNRDERSAVREQWIRPILTPSG